MVRKSSKDGKSIKGKSKVMRLKPEEREIVEHFRETGVLPNTSVISSDAAVIKLKEKAKEEGKRYRDLLKDYALLEKRFQLLIELKGAPTAPFEIKSQSNGCHSCDREATAVAVLSDVHLGEYVNPATVNFKNEYNVEIARERVARFFEKIVRLVKINRAGVKINSLVFAILGDIVGGYIHEEYIEDNLLSPTEASLVAVDILRQGIQYFLDEGDFEQIIVPCSFGNHGRTTAKRKVATSFKNSYEWLIFKVLEQLFSEEQRVKFIVEDGYHTYLDVYGFTLRFHHGDNILYRGGVGGITIPANKAVAQWNKFIPAYLDVCGHYHQQFDGGRIIFNGSVVGSNAFAISIKAEYQEPEQLLFFIDQKYGKTMVCPIFVANNKKVR